MTLDEKINEAKVGVALYEREARKCIRHGGTFYEKQAKAFMEHAKELEQVIEWMEELKAYREAHEKADRPQGEWIPCSKRLPEDSGDYLVCPSDGVIEDYSDCRDVMIMPYDADCEAFGWWTERYDPISLGFVDSDFDEFEVLAWMPLPEPYREDSEA